MDQSLEMLIARERELLKVREAEFAARMEILEAAGRQRLTDAENAEYHRRTDAIISIDRELDSLEGRIAALRDPEERMP
jgi:hypothetical protein